MRTLNWLLCLLLLVGIRGSSGALPASLASLDLSACTGFSVHTDQLRFPSSATAAPPLSGNLGAASFLNTDWGYTRTAPAQACFDAAAADHATVFASPDCDPTPLDASYGTVTFTGGGLRCRGGLGSMTFGTGTVTFDAAGGSTPFIFRVAGSFSTDASVVFSYTNGASAAMVFFYVQTSISLGTIYGRSTIGATFVSPVSIQVTYADVVGQLLTTTGSSQFVSLANGPTNDLAGQSTLRLHITHAIDLGSCANYSIHAGTLVFPSTALAAPTIGGLIGANAFTNTDWGYLRTTPDTTCNNAMVALYDAVVASTDCDPTPLASSSGSTTFSGSVLRCCTTAMGFTAGSVVTFDGPGNKLFRVGGSMTWINGGLVFQYINGATASQNYFVSTFAGGSIAIGGATVRSSVGGTFIGNGGSATSSLSMRHTDFTGKLMSKQLLGITLTSVSPHDAASQVSINPALPVSLAPDQGSTGMAPSSTGVADAPFVYQSDLSLQLTGVSSLMTDEEIGLAVVNEAAAVTGLSPTEFVVRSITTDPLQGTSVVIMRVPLDTAQVLQQFVSSSPDGAVYPVFAHSFVLALAVVVEPDAALPYTPFDPSACNCYGVGTCYGGICGCTPTSAEVGECLTGTVPFTVQPDQICVSRASNPTPSPDLCVSNRTTADEIVYQDDVTCQQRMGSRSRNLFPLRRFCQSLDHSIGVDRFTFSGIFGDPATLVTNTSASIFTFRSAQPNFAALVAAGIDSNTTRVTADVYLSDIYPLHAAPTLSQFWVQIEFDSLYTSALNGTSAVVVLLKRVTGRDTIEGAPNYYWHNNTWNAWVTADWGDLPPSAYAYWNPEASQPAWACFRNHLYDASLRACIAACDNGLVGVECATAIDPDTCIVREWNSTTMLYLSHTCDRVVCKAGYEQTWTTCTSIVEPVVVVASAASDDSSSDALIDVTPVVAVAIVIGIGAVVGLTVLAVSAFGASSASVSAAAVGVAGKAQPRMIHVKPTVKASGPAEFSELKMVDQY